MEAELSDVFRRMRGEERAMFRRNILQVRDIMKTSWEIGGAKDAMMRMSMWFTEKEQESTA